MTAAARAIRIEDPQDERIADYRQLREADLAGRREAFIAESEVVLRILVTRGRFPVRSILLAESRVAKLADVLDAYDPAVPIYTADQAVLSEVVGFRFHRGVVACGQRTSPHDAAGLLEELAPRRVVVLEGLTNHDNVGGIFRNAAAFGADAVLLDATTCDPLYRKAIRVSAGASLYLPWARTPTSAEAIALLKQAGFAVVALSPRPDATPLHALDPGSDRVALLLGTEGPGLEGDTMERADHVCRIEMEPGFDSLNVATTSGIALHHLRTRSC